MARCANRLVSRSALKDAIVDAASTLLAKEGVAGLSYRRVASQVGISPGTMTYHFKDMCKLISAALARLAETIEASCIDTLKAASSRTEMHEFLADLITTNTGTSLVAFMTLPLNGGFWDDDHVAIIHAVSEKTVKALQKHFDEKTARALIVLLKGLSVRGRLATAGLDRSEVLEIIKKIS